MTAYSPLKPDPAPLCFSPAEPAARVSFSISEPCESLEITLHARIVSRTPDTASWDDAFRVYTSHPDVSGVQRDLVRPLFMDRMEKEASWLSCTLTDPEGEIRGRWWLREEASFYLGATRSTKGVSVGAIPAGEWCIEIRSPGIANLEMELSGSHSEISPEPNRPVPMPRFQFHDEIMEDQEQPGTPQWLVGELFDCCEILPERRSPEEAFMKIDALQYQFACLADRFLDPLHQLAIAPNAIPIRGMVVHYDHARYLLLGIREKPAALNVEEPMALDLLARETHEHGGLLTLLEPYGPNALRNDYNGLDRLDAWQSLDLVQVWPGVWEERFPEMLRAFDWWDALLNRGQPVYGICGKGPDWPLDETQVERLPKTLVLVENNSESGILNALIQGHSYMTVEPAIRIWLEAEGGSMQMGGELRLPLNAVYNIRIHVSRMDRSGFLIVKTNTGVYCHMPLSSTRDTDLRFVAHAAQHVTWYRIEVYQYGRPLDRLMALSNPVFVRGLISL